MHEPDGETLLLQHGASKDVARICRVHAEWRDLDANLDELVVALGGFREWRQRPDYRDSYDDPGQLIESLEDAEPAEEVERAWADEIQRRVAALDAGDVEPIPWEQVRARISARLKQRA